MNSSTTTYITTNAFIKLKVDTTSLQHDHFSKGYWIPPDKWYKIGRLKHGDCWWDQEGELCGGFRSWLYLASMERKLCFENKSSSSDSLLEEVKFIVANWVSGLPEFQGFLLLLLCGSGRRLLFLRYGSHLTVHYGVIHLMVLLSLISMRVLIHGSAGAGGLL